MGNLWSVQVTIKKEEWITDPPHRWNHGLSMAGKEWKRQAKLNPKRTGAMVKATTYKITRKGSDIKFYSTFYWIFLMKGTGVFGPGRTPIYPKKGRFLAWTVKGGGMLQTSSGVAYRKGKPYHMRSGDRGLIFARKVKGVYWPGRLDEIKRALREAFREGIQKNAS